MAIINVDDAYILNETGAQVDKTTGIPFKNESLTEAEAAQARANIRAGGSNDNLLDNAYFVGGGSQLGDGVFPINQRGLTSYTNTTYLVDRWRMWANTSTVTLTASGLTFATGANSDGLFQYFPQGKIESLYGLTVTASLLLTDGTLYTATGVADAACWIATDINGGYFGYTNGYFRVNLDANKSISIKAVKLEEGTVSTLANDAPPNYWLELQKCKARLRFVPLTRCPIVFAAGNGYLDLNGCEMEGAPTAALYSNDGAVVGSSGVMASITSVTNIAIQHNVPLLQFNLTGTINDQVGQIYNTVVQLSSEL